MGCFVIVEVKLKVDYADFRAYDIKTIDP